MLVFRNYRRVFIYLCAISLIIYSSNVIINKCINKRSVKGISSLNTKKRNLLFPNELTMKFRNQSISDKEVLRYKLIVKFYQ